MILTSRGAGGGGGGGGGSGAAGGGGGGGGLTGHGERLKGPVGVGSLQVMYQYSSVSHLLISERT